MTYRVSEVDLKITDHAFEEIKRYNPTGSNDFTVNLANLLLVTVSREYEQLRVGYENNIGLEAWACRNLLELNVFVKWVLLSDTNAKRFTADVVIDGIELFESMKEWMEYQGRAIEMAPMTETLRLAYERKAKEGTNLTKHLEVRKLADDLGMTADYKHMMRLCSKLVHPTAWSIIHQFEEGGEYAAFRVILFQSGSRYGLDAFNTIREYMEKQ